MAEITPLDQHYKAHRVAVVGMGIVSPLGLGLDETRITLQQGSDCVSEVTRFSVAGCRCKTAGQIADERLADAGSFIRRPQRLHRVGQMLILALNEALA